MFSKLRVGVAVLAAAASLSACRTFSPDGGMETVAAVAGGGLNKDVVQIRSEEGAAYAQASVSRLLHAPLSADAAVQIALLNNLGLQAAYNRLGIDEAVFVQMSRPPLPSFSFASVSTSLELDFERQIVGSILSLATLPARAKIAGCVSSRPSFAPRRRLSASRPKRGGPISARSRRDRSSWRLAQPRKHAEASAELAGQLNQTGAINKLD